MVAVALRAYYDVARRMLVCVVCVVQRVMRVAGLLGSDSVGSLIVVYRPEYRVD